MLHKFLLQEFIYHTADHPGHCPFSEFVASHSVVRGFRALLSDLLLAVRQSFTLIAAFNLLTGFTTVTGGQEFRSDRCVLYKDIQRLDDPCLYP